MSLLAVENLNVRFTTADGDVHAVKNLSYELDKGETLGIVGESGSGKSQSVLSLVGLLADNGMAHGSARFDGKDLLALQENDLRRVRGRKISMIFQDPMTALNPVISIGAQMSDILYRQKLTKAQKRERAAAMLAQVGIPDSVRRLDDYPHQFSGGMRQRICIAMALMMNPSLLIADEPTTALDVTLEAQIIHLMKELREDFECSMLFVSHNLGLIAELCDEVIVMYAGEVVEQGNVHDLFHRAQHPYTQMLLECDPARISETRKDLPTISGSVPDLVDLPQGCIFSPRCPKRYEPCNESPPGTFEVGGQHSARCFKVRDA